MKHKYSESQELELRMEAADQEEQIKQFFLQAKPLGFPYKPGASPDYTQRILSLFHHNKKVGYLLSENTPLAYEEKERKQYINNIIRYEVFTHKKSLLLHLQQELPYVIEKIAIWTPLLMRLEYCKNIGLKDMYNDSEAMSLFREMIADLKKDTV